MGDSAFTLIFGEKREKLCYQFFSLSKRLPRLFPKELLPQLGELISHYSADFLKTHHIALLRKIVFAHYRLTKKSEGRGEKADVKVFELAPSTYGIAIALYGLAEDEVFNKKHITKSIQNLIPGIKIVPQSYFSMRCCEHNRDQDQIHLYYVEIRKMRGGQFYYDEKVQLERKLPLEFGKAIERFSHALIMPGNEEELFKNIRHLKQELRYFRDPPQVMITFVEYFPEVLKFLVIVVRLIKPQTPSLQQVSTKLPTLVHFSLENLFLLERLRNKYQKEASVFTLEVNSTLFFHNNSINLRAARQYVVKALESMLGPVRDYNGSLLYKENEQLLLIKRALAERSLPDSFLEHLFYGIKPVEMRLLISTQTGVEMISLLHKAMSIPLEGDQKYHLETYCRDDLEIAIIKTKEKEWRNILPSQLNALSLRIGYSCLEYEGHIYLCFFQPYPQNTRLFVALEGQLRDQQSLFMRKSAVLKLNFQAGDPPSLNPHLATDIHCHLLANLLFEGLTRITPCGQVKFAAAEGIELSSCERTYTFRLRTAFWSNGEEVTAYHFERSWKRALMEGTTRIFPSFFSVIKNAQKAREKVLCVEQVGIYAKDAKTLLVELEEPCPYFLNLVATPPFFPLRGESAEPVEFNGPFTLALWRRDDSLVLSQNPFYWDDSLERLSAVQISMVADSHKAYEMYKQGELDFIGDPISPLPPDILQLSPSHPDVQLKPVSRVFWIHCNTDIFPLHNAKLRRALSLALDRKQLIEKVFIHQIPHISPLPAKYSHYKGTHAGDPKLARAYFAAALAELGLKREAFPTLTMTHSDLAFDKPLMEELQRQWHEHLGISIQFNHLPWNEFSAALERKNFQLGGLFRRDFFSDPMFYLSFFKASPTNPHSWENPRYAALLAKYQEEGHPEEVLAEIEALLIEEAPVIALVNQQCVGLINPRIHGFDWHANGCLDLTNIHCEPLAPLCSFLEKG